jgi:beta-glucosidase/6-phospho-beta-glucosidase/beta-galactosidase
MSAKISATVQVTREYDESAIWDALTGSDFVGLNYWVSTMECDWEKEFAPFPVTHRSVKDDGWETTTVTKDMIIAGFTKAIQANYKHCGGLPIFYGEDGDDYDGCFADIVLQCAIFGEVIYG